MLDFASMSSEFTRNIKSSANKFRFTLSKIIMENLFNEEVPYHNYLIICECIEYYIP